VLRTAPAEGLLLGFRAEYSVTAQTEPKTKTCFGLPKPRPIPTTHDSVRGQDRDLAGDLFVINFVIVLVIHS
jgi:hypothetical protein